MTIIRPMTALDADAVLAIYQDGIDTGHASFDQSAPDWVHFDDSKLESPRLVAEGADGRVCGWAVLSPVSSRCVYGGVAESSVYVAANARGRGVGKALLDGMVEASESEGIWTLEAGIFPENTRSIALYEACGFIALGRRRALGKMQHGPLAGQWRDVVFMERRSDAVGLT